MPANFVCSQFMDTKANPAKLMVLLCLYLKILTSLAVVDAITADQSLSGDHTVVSAGGIFELGFFKPGNSSSYYYIGIWYKKVSAKTIVWVANREHPISDRFSSVLRISDGNLVLFDESKTPIWSTNATSTTTLGSGTSIQAILLDNGNLVLRPESISSQLLWQSFDHLVDTLLPGSKLGFNTVTKQTQILTSWKNSEDPSPGDFSLELDPDGSNSCILWSRGNEYWTIGSWNERKKMFGSIRAMGLNNIFNYSYVINENESYFTYSLYDPKRTSRLVLIQDMIQQLMWLETSNQWTVLWSYPTQLCDVYATCGAFSSCNINSSPICNCLIGFEPKSPEEWSLLDFSGGCLRRTTHTSSSENVTNAKGHAYKRSLVIAIVSATAGLLTITFGYFLWKKRSRRGRKYGEIISKNGGENDTELPLFGLRRILAATNNFSEANRLGEGGFGPVYKGIFLENQEVAIKRLSKKSGQGYKEFMNELKLIAKLQHTNLVRLLGCCIEEEERILIYEYMPNRSLDNILFGNPLDSSENTKLDWGKRFQIIKGIAQGVLYIHKYSRLKIIHRDLKASNVLLDEEMNPKISDFGMAKIIEINQTEANTNRVVGTYGYMSPEYALYGHFSEKLDVFSFGVLLLEIVSGRRNSAFRRFENSPTLAGWAWKLWQEGREMEVIDTSIRETCQPHEALRCIQVGFLCVQEDPADRPTMSSVIRMLQCNEVTTLPPSKAPAFSAHCDSHALGSSSSQTCPILSNNEITISIAEGR